MRDGKVVGRVQDQRDERRGAGAPDGRPRRAAARREAGGQARRPRCSSVREPVGDDGGRRAAGRRRVVRGARRRDRRHRRRRRQRPDGADRGAGRTGRSARGCPATSLLDGAEHRPRSARGDGASAASRTSPRIGIAAACCSTSASPRTRFSACTTARRSRRIPADVILDDGGDPARATEDIIRALRRAPAESRSAGARALRRQPAEADHRPRVRAAPEAAAGLAADARRRHRRHRVHPPQARRAARCRLRRAAGLRRARRGDVARPTACSSSTTARSSARWIRRRRDAASEIGC